MTSPFTPLPRSVPVTVVTSGDLPPADTVLTLRPALHEHAAGAECVACAAAGDIRAMLFDLLTETRTGGHAPLAGVVVDARALRDPQPIIDRLVPGRIPALGLRDHAVARSFHLA